jgi:L-aminopeptidase/D-esterase-like protein
LKLDQESADYRRPSLTDIEGILVGHFTLKDRPTGCTVITSVVPFTAGVDVRGGAPGTRETDLLRAENSVAKINAIFLSGGSAFGLDVGAGVVRWLEEKELGYRLGEVRVPIVCGAILFDLNLGDSRIRPDAQAGYEAACAAGADPVAEGSIGAGAGCTVGKMFGPVRAMRGGLGSWAWKGTDGLRVGALAAVNCVGDVWDPARVTIVAGATTSDGKGFVDTIAQLRGGFRPEIPDPGNTVIAVVATNAKLDKAGCTKVAQMSHDALARCIYPAHTPADGDTVFAIATGRHSIGCNSVEIGVIGALAADVLATAIVRGCRAAAT